MSQNNNNDDNKQPSAGGPERIDVDDDDEETVYEEEEEKINEFSQNRERESPIRLSQGQPTTVTDLSQQQQPTQLAQTLTYQDDGDQDIDADNRATENESHDEMSMSSARIGKSDNDKSEMDIGEDDDDDNDEHLSPILSQPTQRPIKPAAIIDDNDENDPPNPKQSWRAIVQQGFRFKSRYFHCTYSRIKGQCITICCPRNIQDPAEADEKSKAEGAEMCQRNYGTALKMGRKIRNKMILLGLGSDFIFVGRQRHKSGDIHYHVMNRFAAVHHTTSNAFSLVDDMIYGHIAHYDHQVTHLCFCCIFYCLP